MVCIKLFNSWNESQSKKYCRNILQIVSATRNVYNLCRKIYKIKNKPVTSPTYIYKKKLRG